MESILVSIKKLLGIDEKYEHFDADIIMHINSVFSILHQLGVGPPDGFQITGADETWSQFIEEDKLLNDVKSFVYLKVQLAFDPPTIAAVLESKTKLAHELEWRINIAAESKKLAS